MFSRRRVLAASLATPLLAQIRPAGATDPLSALRASLARLFPNSREAVRTIGAACHQGSDAARLMHALCPSADERNRLTSASVSELAAMLDAKIRADFVAGRTRRLEGWVLSESETRLYALLAA